MSSFENLITLWFLYRALLFIGCKFKLFKIILITMGFAQCFYGMQILVPILFIVSSFSGFIFCLLFFNELFIAPDTASFWFWIVVLLSVFCASVIGYFAMILPKYGKNNNQRILNAWRKSRCYNCYNFGWIIFLKDSIESTQFNFNFSINNFRYLN